LRLIMNLDRTLVGITTSMSRKSTSTSKHLPSTGANEKYASCSTSTSC
jgi:hypothetical protein